MGHTALQLGGIYCAEPACRWWHFLQGVSGLAHECAMAALQTSQQNKPPRPAIICLTWNEGRCAFPPSKCWRKHACSTCGSSQGTVKVPRPTLDFGHLKEADLLPPQARIQAIDF